MNYKIVSANEWLYPEDDSLVLSNNCYKISCARESYAACQLYLGDVTGGKTIRWKFYTDRFVNDSIIPEIYRLLDVYVEANTGFEAYTVDEGERAGGYVTRTAPFRVYDVMKPLKGGELSHSNKEAFYVRFKVSGNTEPGIYKFTLHMEIGGRSCDAGIEIEVFKVQVPRDETLGVSNWFNPANMAERHNLDPWSEEHWKMIRRYAEMMRHARQTHFLVPIELVTIQKTANGKYCFGFERVKRFILLFLELGFGIIEGGHIAVQLMLGDSHFVLKSDNSVKAISLEGREFIAQYLQAWYLFLKKNNWLDKIVQHAADEPFDASSADYKAIAGMVKRYMPGIRVIEAICTRRVEGAVDILVPTNRDYEEYFNSFELFRKQGCSLWFYTCAIPGGYYMNRLMDIPLLKTRLMHWGNYMYGMEGYLHWGFNCYRKGQNPFEQNCPVHTAIKERKKLPAGDTHIVYPGDDGPWGSVRLEAMRAGIEDYELLKRLELKDKILAEEILSSCMRSFSEVCDDPICFESNYRRLLEALSD